MLVLIDTWWNVNTNINLGNVNSGISVLIDTWWNVNKTFAKIFEELKGVLIDTWWNVNLHIARMRLCIWTVLIDTWWNVNRLMEAGVSPDA